MAKAATKTADKPAEETSSASTAVALSNQSTALAAAPPAELAEFLDQDAGRGLSNSANDVGIPFIYILQALSPQIKKRGEKYVEGAEEGMIINNQTNQLYDGDEGILFIPCFFKSALVEWKPRDAGGGWVAEYAIDDPILKTAKALDPKKPNKLSLPNGNEIAETKYYFGIHILPEGGAELAVLSFASSGLKTSRDWQGILQRTLTASGASAPSFASVFRLKAQLTKKNENEWFTFKVSREGWVNSAQYLKARELAEQCERGLVKASQPDASDVGGAQVDEEVL